MGLKSIAEWYAYCRSSESPDNISSSCNQTYNNEWISWYDWLGKEKPRGLFLSFEKARKFAIKLGLKGKIEWKRYYHAMVVKNIPSHPDETYKDCGWISWMDFLGYEKRNRRQYKIEEDYFRRWSHNMSYILGLWFADGYITSRNVFGITLHKRDTYLLRSIWKEMKSESKIYRSGNMSIIKVSSDKIYDSIIGLGGTKRKSLDMKFPSVPRKYLSDFIRGYFDGDGCIYFDKSNQRYMSSFCCGSYVFICELKSLLEKEIPEFRCSISIVKPCKSIMKNRCVITSKNNAYRLGVGTNSTKRLGLYLYRNEGLKLFRKYDLFQKGGRNIVVYSHDKKFLDFENARRYVRKLNIGGIKEWREYYKSIRRPSYIPSDPYKIYHSKGWINWYDWLGKNK